MMHRSGRLGFAAELLNSSRPDKATFKTQKGRHMAGPFRFCSTRGYSSIGGASVISSSASSSTKPGSESPAPIFSSDARSASNS